MEPYFVEPGYVEEGYVRDLVFPTLPPFALRAEPLSPVTPLTIATDLPEGVEIAVPVPGGRSMYIHRHGDTLPNLVLTLLDAAGEPVKLDDAESAELSLSNGSTVVLTKALSFVTDRSLGQVKLAWASADFETGKVAAAGVYVATVRLTFTGGSTVSAPTISPLPIRIT